MASWQAADLNFWWWKEYFEYLINSTNRHSVEEAEPEDYEVSSLIPGVMFTEALKAGDEICPELLKALDVVGLSWLTRLCNIAWTSGVQCLWNGRRVVVPLFKKQ